MRCSMSRSATYWFRLDADAGVNCDTIYAAENALLCTQCVVHLLEFTSCCLALYTCVQDSQLKVLMPNYRSLTHCPYPGAAQ